MKILSYNVNGMKAFCDKGGLDDVINTFDPDIICFQETKSTKENFKYYTSDFEDRYKRILNESSFKKGYAGAGVMMKNHIAESAVNFRSPNLGDTYESGRINLIEFADFYLINVYYLNSGEKDDLRKSYDDNFYHFISELDSIKPVVIVGDMNVVHNNIDYWGKLENYRNTSPGLKDYERDNFNKLLKGLDLVDTFRQLHPTQRIFSWFSYMGGAFERNQGWRIDLALCSKRLLPKVLDSKVYNSMRYSDHCPIEIEIDF